MNRIYTDGGFSQNRNVGAWAIVVIQDEKKIHEDFSTYIDSTNNKMEMKAIYEAMLYAQKFPNRTFSIVTDSQYVLKSLTEWMPGWIKNDWQTSTGKPVLNKPIWEMMYPLYLSSKNIKFEWTRGHNGDLWNEYADDLCTACMNSYSVEK